MDLRWLDPEQLDGRDLAGAVAVLEAARAVDSPYRPSETITSFGARLRHGGDGDPPLVAVARGHGDPPGRVAGVLRIGLPRWDNTQLAEVTVVVDPPLRRRGLGRQLYEAAAQRARSAGRTLLSAGCFDPGPGMGFLTAMGFDRAARFAFRRLQLGIVDWGHLDRECAAAQRHAAGYELVRLPGPVPDELLPAVVTMTEAINDAPLDELEWEDEAFSPERIRAYEAAQQAQRRRLYRLVARERGTGVLAGHTMVGVDIERPWHAGQHDTSVVRAHRGHRLGLLLKIEMMRWLRDEEPQLRIIDTGNAASNAHMIAVNDALGYELVASTVMWQRRL